MRWSLLFLAGCNWIGAVELAEALDRDRDGVDDRVDCAPEDPDRALIVVRYLDLDGDGWGAGEPRTSCGAAEGTSDRQGDCDDEVAEIFPFAAERCNGIDDDCDGLTDDADDDVVGQSVFFVDGDGDGVPGLGGVLACEQGPGLIAAPEMVDCDDQNASRYPGQVESCFNGVDDDCDGRVDVDGVDAADRYWDGDGDGIPGPNPTLRCSEEPGWYVVDDGSYAFDCNDASAEQNPGLQEIPDDGLDQDCTGLDGIRCPVDVDGDGFAPSIDPVDPTTWVLAEGTCGVVLIEGDCDDAVSSTHAGAVETCNGIDDDCDGIADDVALGAPDVPQWFLDADGDGFGGEQSVRACAPPAGHIGAAGDCDDAVAAVHPGVNEICNGRDDDCNGEVDDSAIDPSTWFDDADRDGYGDPDTEVSACVAPEGHVSDGTDCDDDFATVHPGALEICDALDNDCNAVVDDADPSQTDVPIWYRDIDGDGFAGDLVSVQQCAAPVDHYSTNEDCDDGDALVHPNAPEVCDGIDNDCRNGPDVDATDAGSYWVDSDGDGAVLPDSGFTACVQPVGTVPQTATAPALDCDDEDAQVYPGADDRCDFKDTNCDGSIEEVEVRAGDDLQAAIDAVPIGVPTLVCVDDGRYGPIEVVERDIQLVSRHGSGATIIDGAGGPRVARFESVPPSARFEGFTVEDGEGAQFVGLSILDSDMTVRDVEVRDIRMVSTTDWCQGGAVTLVDSDAVLFGVDVHDNVADCAFAGGVIDGLGVYMRWGSPTIRDLRIHHNLAFGTTLDGEWMQANGAMMYMAGARATVTNFEISENTVSGTLDAGGNFSSFGSMVFVGNYDGVRGGGDLLNGTITANVVDVASGATGFVDFYNADLFTIVNTDISFNAFVQPGSNYAIANTFGETLVVRYTNVFGNSPDDSTQNPDGNGDFGLIFEEGAEGNSRLDPRYRDAVLGDFRLAVDSPLIDVGDPRFNDLDGTRSDVGMCGGPGAGSWCDQP